MCAKWQSGIELKHQHDYTLVYMYIYICIFVD